MSNYKIDTETDFTTYKSIYRVIDTETGSIKGIFESYEEAREFLNSIIKQK